MYSKWWSGSATALPSSTTEKSRSAGQWRNCGWPANRWKTPSCASWARNTRWSGSTGYDRGHPASANSEHASRIEPRLRPRSGERSFLVRLLAVRFLHRRVLCRSRTGGHAALRSPAGTDGGVHLLAGDAGAVGQHGLIARFTQAPRLPHTAREAVPYRVAAAGRQCPRNAHAAQRRGDRPVTQSGLRRHKSISFPRRSGAGFRSFQSVSRLRNAKSVGAVAGPAKGARIGCAAAGDDLGGAAILHDDRRQTNLAAGRRRGDERVRMAVERRCAGSASARSIDRKHGALLALALCLGRAGRLVRTHAVRTQPPL